MRTIIVCLLFIGSFIVHSQDLRIGTLVYAPPFVVAANQKNFFGFDIELMNGICQRMEMRCTYVGMPFQKLFDAVQMHTVDVAIGSITITEEREENLLFSLPYMASRGRFVTTRSAHIYTLADLLQKRIGVIAGRQYKVRILSMLSEPAVISEYKDVNSLLQALNNNKVDVIALSEPMAKYWVSAHEDLYNFVGEGFSLGIGLGIMATPDRAEIITRINKALLDMEADGSYLKLYNLYFGQLTLARPKAVPLS